MPPPSGGPNAHTDGPRDPPEIRRSHPLFLHDYYRKQCRPPILGVINPLQHFCTTGHKAGLSPHPAFDTAYVLEQNGDMLRDGVNPLVHYLEARPFVWYAPNSWFDTVSYNIVHQHGRLDALHPLVDVLRHVDISDIPDPQANPALPADRAGNAGGSAQSGGGALAGVFRGLSALWGGSASRGSVSAGGVVAPAASGGRKATKIGGAGLQAFRHAVARVAEALRNGDETLAAGSLSTARLEAFLGSQDIHATGQLDPGWPASRRGVAIYAVYAPQGRLNQFHRALLAALRARDYAVILVNSSLAGGAEFRAEALSAADVVVQRRGGGRDFASWVAAIAMHYDLVSAFDHLVFVNDSLLGPIDSLDPVWAAFEASTAPVWGLTESNEIRRHLQSSFFIMRRAVVQSPTMISYLARYGFPDDRREVVQQGELGLGAVLASAGIPFEAMVSYQDVTESWLAGALERQRWYDSLSSGDVTPAFAAQVPPQATVPFAEFAEYWTSRFGAALRRGEPVNPQHVFWDVLWTKFHYPFVKRELLAVNPLKVPSVARIHEMLSPNMRASVLRGLEEVVPPSTPLSASVFRISRQTAAAWLAAVEP